MLETLAESTRLRPGLELVGTFDGAGSNEAKYLIRRIDGRMVLVSPLIYTLVESMFRTGDAHRLAADVSRRTGQTLTADGVRFLIEQKVRPLGLLDEPSPSENEYRLPAPALTVRRTLLSGPAVATLAAPLSRLFAPAIWIPAVLASGASLVWLGLTGRLLDTASVGDPAAALAVLLLTLISAVWHELGHAAGGHKGGAVPGPVGVGIYVVWPAFFSNLTDGYRLHRRGRIRTDLGGIYFNLIFVLALTACYALSGAGLFAVAVGVQVLLMAVQFIPFLRLDGYWLLSDISGVPDLFALLGDTIRGGLRGRSGVNTLRPGVALFATYWMVLTTLILVTGTGWVLFHLPKALSAVAKLVTDYLQTLLSALDSGAPAMATLSGIALTLACLQVVGLVLWLIRGVVRLGYRLAPS